MILQRWSLRTMLPLFIGATVFFAIFIEIIDLFQDLTRYLQMKQSIVTILQIQLLYLPKCLSFGIPIAMVFAVAFTLGNHYANNELIAVFSSGISLLRFCLPMLAAAAVVSAGSFFFQEKVVIDTLRQKNELRAKVLGFSDATTNPNVVLFDQGTKVVYKAVLYNDGDQSLSDLIIVVRDDQGRVERVVKAQSASWDAEAKRWQLSSANEFRFRFPAAAAENAKAAEPAAGTGKEPVLDKAAPAIAEAPQYEKQFSARLNDPQFTLEPQAFRRISQNVEELPVGEAGSWVASLKKSGLPYLAAQTKLYERYSFACTPLLVAFLACSIGSRFRKNILLLSLLVSLMIAVIYYVIQMIAGLLATFQLISPLVGAWTGVAVFALVGAILFRQART